MMHSKFWCVVMMAFCLALTAYAQEEMEMDPDAAEYDTEGMTEKTEESVMDTAKDETVTDAVKNVEVHMPCLTADNSEKLMDMIKKIEGIDKVSCDLDAKKVMVCCSESLDFDNVVMPKLKELDKDVTLVDAQKTE